ncbi:MAG: LLM class flavin-dependent oxidoreductase [Solirubrobacteraceae bacterium]
MSITVGFPGQIMPPARRAVELAQKAEANGFDSVWWPDHLMGWHPDSVWNEDFTPLAAVQDNPHMYFEPLTMMGAAGAATERVRVGTCVTEVMRRHPAMLAQHIVTVDHLSEGRAILGLGSGERLNVEPYGMDWRKPVGRLKEGLEVMRLLWASDRPVDFHGDFFRLEDAIMGLPTYQGKDPDIWLASHGPRMLELAGREADGWLPTFMSPEDYGSKLGTIREHAERAGRDPMAIVPSMLAYTMVAPDEETLDRLCEHPLVRLLCVLFPAEAYAKAGATPPFEGGSGFHSFVPTRVSREEAERVLSHIPGSMARNSCLHGTAEQIADQLRTFGEAGMRDVILWNITAFADPSLAGYSFREMKRVKEILAADDPTTIA